MSWIVWSYQTSSVLASCARLKIVLKHETVGKKRNCHFVFGMSDYSKEQLKDLEQLIVEGIQKVLELALQGKGK